MCSTLNASQADQAECSELSCAMQRALERLYTFGRPLGGEQWHIVAAMAHTSTSCADPRSSIEAAAGESPRSLAPSMSAASDQPSSF